MISSTSPKVSKIHYSLLILFSSICLFGFSNPYGKNAVNLNPKSIQDKNYQWTEAKAEGTYEKRTPVEDQWFSQYTPKKPGYIRKTDGSFEAGDLEIRYRYNQASEEKVRNSEGNKVPHPDGWKGISDIYLTVDGEKQSYKLNEIKQYGYQFTAEEWAKSESSNPLQQFNNATLFFKDGNSLDGKVRFEESKNSFELNKYSVAFYLGEEFDFVLPYPSSELIAANVQTAGSDLYLDRFNSYLIEAPLYYKAFSNRFKEYKLDPPISCTLVDDNGQEIKGEVFFDKGKKKKKAYFFNAEHNQLMNLKKNSFSVLRGTVDGKEHYINYFEGKFMSLAEIRENLNKKELLFPGEIFLEDGKSVKGEVYFLRMQNVVKSYRFIKGFSMIPEGKNYFQRFDNGNIDYVLVKEAGQEKTYLQVGDYYEDQDHFVESLKNSNSPDPFRNLRDGYLMMESDQKIVGKIAASPPSTIYFLGDDGIPVKYKANEKKLIYYVQEFKGVKYKFVGLQKRSTLLNNPHIFQKIEAPWEKYSYYKNPYPTHIRKGMTNFAAGAATVASNEIQEEMAYHGAKEAARQEMKESGNALNASREADRAYRDIRNTQMIEVDENPDGGIFFDEYVVFENQGDDIFIIYQKNDEAELNKLLGRCKDFQTLPEKRRKRLTKVEFIKESVNYLNTCE